MSGLDDFFAKKDRKKKKSSSRTFIAPPVEKASIEDVTEEPAPAPIQVHEPKPVDDGWIEIDDPRGSQVNTGGRTVAEYKRDGEEKEPSGEGAQPTEKFSGWGKVEQEDSAEKEDEKAKTALGNITKSAFPSLADSADAPQIPSTRGKPSTESETTSRPVRRRFFNSKLNEGMAEKSKAGLNK